VPALVLSDYLGSLSFIKEEPQQPIVPLELGNHHVRPGADEAEALPAIDTFRKP
jgi:hypothetical protein